MNTTLNTLLDKYPSWMRLRKSGDPIRGIFESLGIHLLNLERGNRRSYYSSFLVTSDVDADSNYNMYYVLSGDINELSIISGYYDTMDATGEIDLVELNEDETENYYPTRGFAMEKIPLSESGYILGLCYLDEIISGTLLISYDQCYSIYSLDENYDSFDSVSYCLATAEFYPEFEPLSGDLYKANLFHKPLTYEFKDIYDKDVPISGIFVEGQHAFIFENDLQGYGRILAHMTYELCACPYRIKTDMYRWQYFLESEMPDILLANYIAISGSELC